MSDAVLMPIRETGDAETGIVFVHGFGGDAVTTWGRFPEFVCQAPALHNWDVYSLGYKTGLAPDVKGVWEADPDIATLALYLNTCATQLPLKRYQRIAIAAHSMGGLVVQRALVEFDQLARRVSHVLLFGTPSKGLKKASGWLSRMFKRQSQDMARNSRFILDLRRRWTETFGSGRPFGLWVVAGDTDEFVPAESSLSVFDKADRVVVPGNHLQIVKPETADALSVKVLLDAIVGDAAPGGPWNAARVALELGEFQEAIDLLMPKAKRLDDRHLVKLALALDATGRRDRAIEVLEGKGVLGTDALGVLAGRFKRSWLVEGLEEPARRALSLYQQAYEDARTAERHAQASYHGINIAFMRYVFEQDPDGAKAIAAAVLDHCQHARKHDHWWAATVGEAHLYLGETDRAMEAYRQAVAMYPAPRDLESMYTQARWVTDVQGNDDAARSLEQIFRT